MAVKRHRDHENSYKRKHVIGAGFQSRGLGRSYHGRKHGGTVQADAVLEKELRGPHLGRQVSGRDSEPPGLA